MSMLSEQAKELRRQADVCECFIGSMNYAKHFRQAADTIESLSAKLAATNMERSERILGDCIDRQELMCELSEIFQDDATNDRFNYVLELADMYAEYECCKVSDRYYGGRWIPCSEKFPEKFKPVLVCDKKGNVCIRSVTWVGDGYCSWTQNKLDVVAWMPLPEPYNLNDLQE